MPSTVAQQLPSDVVRESACGHWPEIFSAMGIAVGTGKHGPCPVCGGKDRFRCDDTDGSGSWFCNQCSPQAGDGFQLVQNVRGCDFPQAVQLVADALGHHSSSVKTPRKIVAEYNYSDEAGTLLFQVVRYQPKDFRQRRPDGQGGWVWSLKGVYLVLYRLPEVLQAENVLILEGERDVETAYSLGLPDGWAATCNPMGAGKWREDYSESVMGKQVVILPDADEPGRKHGEQVAHALQGKAKRVHLLKLPEEFKDLTDWTTGKTGADLVNLLTGNSIHAYRPHPPHESNFHPIAAPELLAEPPEEVDWIMEEYLSAGGLILLAGKPKEGKTTLAYELVIKVALGLPFLGRNTRKASVLILALEEHAREVRMRLRNLGALDLDNVYVHVGPLEPTTTAMNSIKTFAHAHGVRLILVDTLSAFWRIENENDAAEMTKVVKPLLQLARESGACVLLIHHARKSEGQYGDEIRGSGALFAAVDVAIVMKRHEVHTQRLLQAQSRYPETPSELVIELRDHGYEALGDPAKVGKEVRLTKLATSLSDQWEEAEQIANRAALSQREGHRLLGLLVKEGKAVRDGKGVKNSPFRFKRNSIHAGGQSIGHESNDIKPDSIHATPPSPCMNGNEDALTEEEVDLVD